MILSSGNKRAILRAAARWNGLLPGG